MKGKDIAIVGAMGVIGYAAYKMLTGYSSSDSSPSPVSQAIYDFNYKYNPLTTDNPNNIISAVQQLTCPRNQVYNRQTGQCYTESVFDPQTHQVREWRGTSGSHNWLTNWLINGW
jgi:hypothetical protein